MIDRIYIDSEIFGKVDIDLINKKTNKPYQKVAFVGENGCGKTSILNELFKSDQKALFIRQNSLFCSSQNESIRMINGINEYYKSLNFKCEDNFCLSDKFIDVICNNLKDEQLNNILKNNLLKNVKYGGEVLKLIDGSTSSVNIDDLSSGQKEIISKLSLISKCKDVEIVLLDEPETSLHPRWQREIVNTIYSLVGSENKMPQLFVATHSEKVLESLLNNEDTLIIICNKEEGKFYINPIYEFKRYLPSITIAELDYLIFGIVSMEYHDQLFNEYSNIIDMDIIGKIDESILANPLYSDEYKKEWRTTSIRNDGKIKTNEYDSLPVYIRNYFHHPKEGMMPTNKEIEKSIRFISDLIDSSKQNLI